MNHFGLQNLVRMDDSIDQYWRNDGRITVKPWASGPALTSHLGISMPPVIYPATECRQGMVKTGRPFHSRDSGRVFRFGLDPGGAPLWSSAPAYNSDKADHMVTWKITANNNRSLVGAYITAWEDLAGGGDGDFNDLVMLIKGDVSLDTVICPRCRTR